MERDYGVLGGPEPDEEAADLFGGRIRARRLLANGA
jgi:hypothetical protein